MNEHVTLTGPETRRIRAHLKTLRGLEGKPVKRNKITNIADRVSAILSRAERRDKRTAY